MCTVVGVGGFLYGHDTHIGALSIPTSKQQPCSSLRVAGLSRPQTADGPQSISFSCTAWHWQKKCGAE